MARFKATKFDPYLIALQIIFIQCCFYLFLTIFIGTITGLQGIELKLGMLIGATEFNLSNVQGITLILAYLLSATAVSWMFLKVVERSRLCLDFGCTLYGLHILLVSWFSAGIPFVLLFWIVMIACCTTTIMLSQNLCMEQELTPIVLSGGAARQQADPEENLELSTFNNNL